MGRLIEWADNKYDAIYDKINSFFADPEVKGKLQFINVYPIFCNYLIEKNDYKKLSNRNFDDPDELMYCFMKYQEIMAYINAKVVFVPSIENFCMFMGWTANFYKRMLDSSSSEMQGVMQIIEDYMIESQISAGQAGFLKSNLTKFRTQLAGDHGNNLVTQKEANEDKRANKGIKSKEQLMRELEKLTGCRKIE